MVTLIRAAGGSFVFFVPAGFEAANADARIGFLPAMDTGAGVIDFGAMGHAAAQTLCREGFWAIWGPPDDGEADFVAVRQRIDRLLRTARQETHARADKFGRRIIVAERFTGNALETFRGKPDGVLAPSGTLMLRHRRERVDQDRFSLDVQQIQLNLATTGEFLELASIGQGYNLTARPFDPMGKLVEMRFTRVAVPLSGDRHGCFVAEARVPAERINSLGLISCFPARGPLKQQPGGKKVRISEVSYGAPITSGSSEEGKALNLYICLDLSGRFDPGRTWLAPRDPLGKGLLSGFGTTLGHDVLLKPLLSNRAKFVFARVTRKENDAPDPQPISETDVLVLEGDMEVAFADGSGPVALDLPAVAAAGEQGKALGLVLGDSVAEYVPIPPTTAAPAGAAANEALIMQFRRGPAFFTHAGDDQAAAASEPEDTSSLTLRSDPYGLSQPVRDVTPWIRLARGEKGRQRVVSEAPEHRLMRTSAQAGLREHAPVDLELKPPPKPGMPEGFLPALPALGRPRAAADPKGDIEARLLARERRKLLKVASGPGTFAAAAGAGERRRTPLGFEVVTDGLGRLTRLILALTETPGDNGAPAIGKIEIEGIDGNDAPGPLPGAIVDMFFRNRLFAVVNYIPDKLDEERCRVTATVTAGGWTFTAPLGVPPAKPPKEGEAKQDTPKRPYLIIKGYDGLTIRKLAERPELWSGRDKMLATREQGKGDALEEATRTLKDWLTKIDGKKASFKPIADAVDDPNWSGVLLIDVEVSLADLPQQVKGLVGGMQVQSLRAHHLGVPIRPLDTDNAVGKAFGILSYNDDKPKDKNDVSTGPKPDPAWKQQKEDEDAFDLQVGRLDASFHNGEITSFACDLYLTLGKLFYGDSKIKKEVDPTPDPDGARVPSEKEILLKGRHERRIESGVPVDVYSFESRARITAEIDKLFVKTLELKRIGFVTERGGTGQDPRTDCRFLLDGKMTLQNIKGVDLGLADIDPIDFSNLGIDLSFLLPDKGDGKFPYPKFRFSPGAVSFDFAKAKATGGGFWSSFPLKFSGFSFLDARSTLSNLGFFQLGNYATGAFRFALHFDVDLGSLGSLVGKGKAFGLKLALGFDMAADDWGLGFKFENSGRAGLDIGLQGILELSAERYDIKQVDYKGKKIYSMYALNALMKVFGRTIPDGKINVFIFADPDTSSVGWYLGYMPKDVEEKSDFKTKVLTLGQRIDPAPGFSGKLSRDLLKAMTALRIEKIEDLVPKLDGKQLKFDPERGWSIAADLQIYQKLAVRFAMRDPDLYGAAFELRLTDPNSPTPDFGVDIFYRKLTDDLGVYSGEIIVPPAYRQLEFGAASVTVPQIGFEYYTDGGFAIDLGFPRNRDFARAFAFQILPFTGGGGFYFRRASGPASERIPPVNYRGSNGIATADPTLLRYDPVTEIGIGFRVGLGKDIARGAFRAGLSLTVYAYLEGSYGRLHRSEAGKTLVTGAAGNYIVVSGSVGIMGEVYGYVDFGIVRAGVSIRLWVETGFKMETDQATLLYIQAGVSVSVEVEVGRICCFGKCLTIRISFSFSTTVEFSTTIGSSDRTWYGAIGGHMSALALARAGVALPVPNWGQEILPPHWRAGGATQKAALEMLLTADVALVATSDPAGFEAEAVPLLTSLLTRKGQGQQPTGVEELVRALAAWALAGALNKTNTLLTEHEAAGALRELADKVAGRGVWHSADRRALVPRYEQIQKFLEANFEGRISLQQPEPGVFNHAVMPMPPEMAMGRTGLPDVRPGDLRFVDDAYRKMVDEELEKLMLLLASESRPAMAPMAAAAPRSLVETLFEEWFALVVRSSLDRVARLASENQGDSIGQLLDRLLVPATNKRGALSPAAEIAAMASRFFLHGQRLPAPDDRSLHLPLQSLAGLQFPIPSGDKAAITARDFDAGWVKASKLDPMTIDRPNIDKLVAAAKRMSATSFGGKFGTPQLVVSNERVLGFRAGPRLGAENWALQLMTDEMRLRLAKEKTIELREAKQGKPWTPTAHACTYAIATEIAIRRVPAQGKVTRKQGAGDKPEMVPNVYELAGQSESQRALLDALELETGGKVAAIRKASLWVRKPDGSLAPLSANNPAAPLLVQTNVSTEPTPGQEFSAFAAGRPDIKELEPFEAPWIGFIELARRAAIVNTGGFLLTYPDADAELKALFEPTDADPKRVEDGAHTVRLLLLIELEATEPALANALITPVLENGEIMGAALGKPEIEPAHEPGVLPVWVTRAPPPADPAELTVYQHFSILAVELLDAKGKSLNPNAIPTGAQTFGNSPEREWRVSLPVAALLADKDGKSERKDINPYDAVGEKVRVRAAWRDIYGNGWPIPFEKQETIGFTDRIVPISDLPWAGYGYWPTGEDKADLEVWADFSRYGVDPTNAAWGNDEAKAWLSTALGEIDRGIAILKRARQQLTSRRGVTLTAETPLSAQPIAIPSTFLSDFISEILTVAGGIESKLEVTLNAPAGATPAAVQALVATIGAARVAKRSHPLAWKRAPQHDVIEMGLDLCQQRDARYVLDRELSLIPEITFVKVPLAPAIWREADIENRTVRHYLDAMLAISSEHHVATGYGDIPSLVERKTWLVHKKVVPANGAEWNAPVAVAVPPLSTRPFGADLRDVKRFVEPPGGGAPTVELRQVSIRDADIDALAAEAYRRIDGALSAEVVASLTKDERSLVRDLLKSKEVIAGSIARSVTPVLQNVPEPAKNRMDNLHAGLADRFKRRLAGIYEIDTVLYYGDTHPSASLGSLCRQLHGTIEPDEPGAKPQALSGAVFEAFNLPVQSDDETAPSKRVTRDLVVSADAPPKLAGLLHLPKWYKITHLQRLGRQTVSSAGVGETGRYRPTAWLTLYATDNRFRINLPGGGTKGLPIVVRELPNRPALETDGWEAEPISGSDQKERLASARRWRAWRDWRQDGQKETGDSPDFLTVTLTYSAAGGMSAMAEDTSDKFAAYRLGIATFVRATDEAWDQLVKPDSPVRRHAFRYLSERATELAATLTQPRDFAAAANTTDKDTLELHEVERIEKPTRIKAKITGAKFDPSVELRLYARGKDGKLDSETSKRVPLKQGSDSVSLDLDAVKEGPGEKRRRLEASRLDIFKRNSAMIELLLVRNKYFDRPDDPGKMDVAESFVYRLPAVTSPQPQRPYLDRTSQRIDCEALSVAKLDDGIKKFLIDLLQGDGQIVQGLRVDVLAEFVPDIFKYGGRGAPIPARSFKTSDPQADAKLLSKPIADWLARERPARRKDGELRGQLRLDLRFYDDSGRPILRLADCRFPLVP